MNKNHPYSDLNLQLIGGVWREGRTARSMTVSDPFTQQTLLEIALANKDDLNEAYAKAKAAQPGWAAMGPSTRAGVQLTSKDRLKPISVASQEKCQLAPWVN
ncbi:aldehyde dehydrogenase family protein [Pseudomonas sp. SMN5]|uniref:aldehyde dehydrogenase family protein n=1 Tax=Pseudomonas sp. SMN5 TaxID=3390198 RepID=UPI003F87E14D